MRDAKSLSDSELLKYANEHLQYEIDLLTWSAGILASLASHIDKGQLPRAIRNSILESFALHARNLIDFLYTPAKYPTDVALENFVDAGPIACFLPAISSLLEEARTKANKQAAHLTTDRIEYERAGKEWRYLEIANQILKAFASIAPHIPSGKISHSLRQKLIDPCMPIVDFSTGELPSGVHKSVTFSLSLQKDGRTIKGGSA